MPKKSKNKKEFWTRRNVIIRIIAYPISLFFLFLGVRLSYSLLMNNENVTTTYLFLGIGVGLGLSVFPICYFLFDYYEIYYGDDDNIGMSNVLDDIL